MACVDSLDKPETQKRVAAEEPASGPEKKARTEATAEDEDELDDSWADSVRVPAKQAPDEFDDSWADLVSVTSKPTPAAASSADTEAPAKEVRAPLDRLRGAERDLKPAWQTKGIGVGKMILGESTGELMKPGLTKADLEKLESQSASAGPDPFGEVFRDAVGKAKASAAADPASVDKLESVASGSAEKLEDSPTPAAAAGGAAAEVDKAAVSDVSAAAEDRPTETAAADASAEEPPAAAAQANPEDALTVFVGNISFTVDEEQFELDFSECGEIENLRFIEGRGLAFVTYETAEGAAAALKLDGDEYWGRALKVQMVAPRQAKEGKAQELFEVYVRGLSKDVQEASLRKLFEGCGEIASMRIPRDEEGKAKGVAFLDFKTLESLEKAVELNGKEVDGLELLVEKARGRDGRGKGKGKDGKGKGKDGKGKGKGKDKGQAKGKGKGGKGKGKGKDKGKGAE